MISDDDSRLKKLRFRAWRRGFREADLILGPFADNHVASFSDEQLDWFEALLEQPDQDLYAWIIGAAPTPVQFDGEIMCQIKAFRLEIHVNQGGGRGG